MNLFLPDNFSDPKVKYEIIDTRFSIFHQILKNYFDNFIIHSILKVGGTAAHSENYKVIYSRQNQLSEVLVRKHKTLQANQIEFYSHLSNKLYQAGAQVSAPLKTRSGDWIMIWENNYYQLYNFIDAEHFYPQDRDFSCVAQVLARLHLAFNDFDVSDLKLISNISQQGNLYFNVIATYSEKDFIDLRDIINNKSVLTSTDLDVLNEIPNFIRIVKEINKLWPDIEKLPKQIIHSDTHPHNFLLQDNEVKAILDLGGMRISQQARDVAHAIYRLGRQFFVHKILASTKQNAQYLTQLFIKKYSEIKFLSPAEIELMPYLLQDEFIRKNLFVLNGIYKCDNHAWADNLSKFLVAPAEINFFW